MRAPDCDDRYLYDAFISYSRRDTVAARVLEKALERYKIPKLSSSPARHLNIFRDEEDLVGTQYHESIEQCLSESKKLIVLCTPDAAKSQFVDDEITAFLKVSEARHIIPVLVDGMPNNEVPPGDDKRSFPPALVEALTLPLAVDLRHLSLTSRKISTLKGTSAWLTLVANILDMSRAELERRDARRRLRTQQLFGGIATTVIAMLTTLTVYAFAQRDAALKSALHSLSVISHRLTLAGNPTLGMLLAKATLPQREPRDFVTPSSEAAMLAARLAQKEHAVVQSDSTITTVKFSPTANGQAVLVAGSAFGEVSLFKVGDSSLEKVEMETDEQEEDDLVSSASFSSDGGKVVTAHRNKTARVWRIGKGKRLTGKLLQTLEGHDGAVGHASFSSDGVEVVTASEDKTVRVWNAETGVERLKLEGHDDAVRKAAFSSDDAHIITVSADGSARVWNAKKRGKPLCIFSGAYGERVSSAALSDDGTRIAIGRFSGRVQVLNFALADECTGWRAGEAGSYDQPPYAPSLEKSDECDRANSRQVGRESDMGSFVKPIAHKRTVNELIFAEGGKRLLSISSDRTAHWRDGKCGKVMSVFKGHKGIVTDADYHSDSDRPLAATASADNTIRLWDLRERRLIDTYRGHTEKVWSTDFSPDGRWLASGSQDGTLRVWKVRDNLKFPTRLSGHTSIVLHAIYSPEGDRIITISRDGTAKIWDSKSAKLKHILKHPDSPQHPKPPPLWVASVPNHRNSKNDELSSDTGDKDLLLTTADDGTIGVWHIGSGAQRRLLEGHEGMVLHARFSPDATKIVSGGEDKTVRIWDVATGDKLASLPGHECSVNFAEFSNMETGRILTADACGCVCFWDADTYDLIDDRCKRKPDARVCEHADASDRKEYLGSVNSAVFSDDGSWAITGFSGGEAIVWDTERGQEIHNLSGHTAAIQSVDFSTDGKLVATGSADSTVRLWGAKGGRERAVLRGHGGEVRSVKFSEDGRLVLSASADGTSRLWHVDTRWSVFEFDAHALEVVAARFSPQGKQIITASWDHSAYVWDLPIDLKDSTSSLRKARKNCPPRSLTEDEKKQYQIDGHEQRATHTAC